MVLNKPRSFHKYFKKIFTITFYEVSRPVGFRGKMSNRSNSLLITKSALLLIFLSWALLHKENTFYDEKRSKLNRASNHSECPWLEDETALSVVEWCFRPDVQRVYFWIRTFLGQYRIMQNMNKTFENQIDLIIQLTHSEQVF